MENSNKKIVIKKILSNELKANPTHTFEEEELDNKIDVKFFEPINEENIDGVLKELEKEDIQYDTIKTRLSEEELQRAGITLAKRIFELAQPRRETRDSLYLNAFNVVLESYRISDQYRILQVAHQFFLNEYRDYMETRGERPGILSQIVRRVGKENQEKYRHIVNGVNLSKIAKNIFDILNDKENLKQERIKNLLYGNSKNEISAIRSKINIYFIDLVCHKLSDYIVSYKQINKKNEDILFELFADKEEYKKYFYTYTSPEEEIYYLLSGREEKEINLIKDRYNKLKQKDSAFNDDLSHVFKGDPITLNEITTGINYEDVAKKIYDMLYPKNDETLGEELLSAGVYHKINFSVNLHEISSLSYIDSHEKRQIHQREKILQEFSYLKGNKANKANEALKKSYGITLSLDIFPELFSFDPQQIAFKVNNALFLRLEVFDIIKILRFYDTFELNKIKKAYKVNFNSSLEDDIYDYAIRALKGRFNDHTKNAFSDILSGLTRLDSSYDLVSYLLASKDFFTAWDAEHQISQNITNATYRIAEIINDETLSFEEIEASLTNILKNFSYDEMGELKQMFYNLVEPKETFTKIIVDIFGTEKSLKLDYIINNFKNDNKTLRFLLPCSPLYLQNELAGNNLENLKSNLSKLNLSKSNKDKDKDKDKDEDEYLKLLNATNLYANFLVRNFYTHILRGDDANKFVLEAFDLDYKYIKAVELIFNAKYSSLRRLLKEMANIRVLSNDVLALTILKLENIPITIVDDILFCINQKKIRDALKIFNKYPINQKTLEDIFEIITLPSDVRSPKLKQIIKESGAKLTDINECILYLDGFSPKELAKKLRQIIVQNLAEFKNDLVKMKDDLTNLFLGTLEPNLIPSDVNWKIEQNYIATLYYKSLFNEDIIETFKKLNFSSEDIISLATLIYGEEIVSKALILEDIVSEQVIEEHKINTLKQILPLRHKRFMMILRKFFNSYTAHNKKLEDYIEENEKIRRLFLGQED
ncbi:MAG: hypothetical protein ACOX3T_00405 [Bdellovibrionota bacterium]